MIELSGVQPDFGCICGARTAIMLGVKAGQADLIPGTPGFPRNEDAIVGGDRPALKP